MVCDLEIWRHIATEAHWKSCEASRALCAVKWLQKKVQEEKNVDLMAHQSLKEQPHHSHSTSAWDMRTTKMNWRETHLMCKSSGKCLSTLYELPSHGQPWNTGSQRLSWTSPWRPSLWPSNSDCYKPWSTNCVAGQRSLWLTPGRIWKVIKRSSKVMIWLRIKFDIYNSLTKLEICWKVRKRNELACLPPLDVKAARGLQCPWPTTRASDLRNQNHGLADGSAGMRSEAIFWRWFFGWSNTQKFHIKNEGALEDEKNEFDFGSRFFRFFWNWEGWCDRDKIQESNWLLVNVSDPLLQGFIFGHPKVASQTAKERHRGTAFLTRGAL